MLIALQRKKWLRERASTLPSYVHCLSCFRYRKGHGSICTHSRRINPLNDDRAISHSKLRAHNSASDFR